MAKQTITVGWKEWCALPELAMPALKVKIDTGAKTSSLHAVHIKPFEENGVWYVRFDVHPVQKNTTITKPCVARLVGQRRVKSSNGHEEKRYVICTPIAIAGQTWDINITLTNRDAMGMRMLLGREAMKHRILVNPTTSYCHGKMTIRQAMQHYLHP